ncbi:MFS transporter [Streptantibioticus ferralitis]|uniref:MFS transporter n=1 Tax=Streptantibioticus ferralitis TaxID=236510 RepID=A0ABT5YVC7_9ACTN|nr:MFS transporter [Streptantibioticus ferralitis]MDF2255535.1 MFS transporter [Streptantibioticus ferralitis]
MSQIAGVPVTDAPRRTNRAMTLVLAVACGLTVANLYYSQPLLDLIAGSFGVSQGAATVVVTLTQAGYAVGLLFLLTLGDLVENRTLATRTLVATAIALLLTAVSPVFGMFLAVSVLVGVTSVVAQVLVPLAAHLAPADQRGKFVGRVMSGLLLGILLARTISSLVADLLGWRAIYFVSAALMIVLSAVLHRMLPKRRPDHTASYRSLLASVGELVRNEPVLRRRALCQAMMFGAFTAFWTAIAYELIGEHGFGQAQIALFALVGAGGAAAAPIGGWVADRGHGRAASGGALLLASLTFVLAALGHRSVLLLALAAVLLDFAVQCHQVMSQHEIYGLRADARARINTVYMTTVFVGGAVSSAVTGVLYSAYAWTGTCLFAMVLPLVGLLVWAYGWWTTRRARPSVDVERLVGVRHTADVA